MKLKSLALSIILLLCIVPFIHAQNDSDERPFTSVEKLPIFPGGEAELMKYLSEKIKQYINPTTDTIQSKVNVRFIVGSKGVIKDCVILRSYLDRLDNDNICKTILSMPTWTPPKQNNRPVPVYFTLPITYYTSLEKQNAVKLVDMGADFFEIGFYEKALEKYEEAIIAAPNYTLAQLDYAATLIMLERYDEGVEIFEKQYNLDPNKFDYKTYTNWGDALLHLEKPNEAMQQYEMAAKTSPNVATSYYNKAMALYKMEKYKEASQKLNELAELIINSQIDSNDVSKETYVLWGNVCIKLAKYKEATGYYKVAISRYDDITYSADEFRNKYLMNQHLEPIYTQMAYALLMNEQYNESIEYLGYILAIDEENTKAYNNWAKCLIKLEENEEALEKLETSLKISPYNNETITMLINLYTEMGQNKKANKLLKEKEKRESY